MTTLISLIRTIDISLVVYSAACVINLILLFVITVAFLVAASYKKGSKQTSHFKNDLTYFPSYIQAYGQFQAADHNASGH